MDHPDETNIKKKLTVSGFLKIIPLFVITFYITFLGVVSLEEVTNRTLFIQQIDSEIASNSEQLANLMNAGGGTNTKATDGIRKRIQALSTEKGNAVSVIILGTTDNDMTMVNIRNRLFQANPNKPYKTSPEHGWDPFFVFDKISKMGSGTLTSYVVVIAAVLGSFIRFVRMGYERFAHTLISGVGAGAICYLAAYGGILYTGIAGASIASNPYNNALISFIAGLFSLQFFETLRELVERGLKGLPDKVFGGASPTPSQDPNSEKKPKK